MSQRFFSADFHIGMSVLLDKELMGDDVRPFSSVEKMNAAIVRVCNQQAKVYTKSMPVLDKTGKQRYVYECIFDENGNITVDPANMHPVVIKRPMIQTTVIDRDTIIHAGDLFCFRSDRGNAGLDMKPTEFIEQIHANFINIKGNHDVNNKVKSACSAMQLSLGKRFPNVTIGHYPSWDSHAKGTFREGWIHLHGHLHAGMNHCKHCLDLTHQVLNICISFDAWKYKLVSEIDLIGYIEKVLRLPKEKLNRVKLEGSAVVTV